MSARENTAGGYVYSPGIEPYSGGVRAMPGHRIVHVTFRQPPAWQQGFVAVDELLAAAGRPAAALCSIELRCQTPHTFEGFIDFNHDYRAALDQRGLLLGDDNPIARTNVSPAANTLTSTVMHGFGYTVASGGEQQGGEQQGGEQQGGEQQGGEQEPSFVIAGAGDLRDQSELAPEAIVAAGARWLDSGPERATVVLDEMEARMTTLGVTWADATTVDVYTAEPLHHVLGSTVLPRLGEAAARGVHWYLSHPPIVGLTFEMDLRGGVDECLI